MYKIFRGFMGTWVTFWKLHRLRKLGCYWLPMKLRFLSHSVQLEMCPQVYWRQKVFNKCKIKTKNPSISFLLEKNYMNMISVTLLECSFEVSYHEGLDSLTNWFLTCRHIPSSGFVVTEEWNLCPDFIGRK